MEPQLHIKTGTYKEEFAAGIGWAVERITMPKSLGSWWLNFRYAGKDIKVSLQMTD